MTLCGGSWAICAGVSTGTRRTLREATRPFISVVVIGSSRSPARVDQVLQIVAVPGAAEDHLRAGVVDSRRGAGRRRSGRISWERDWNAAMMHTPRPPMSADHRSNGIGANQCGLVERQGQRRVQPPARLASGDAPGLPSDVPGPVRTPAVRCGGLLGAGAGRRWPSTTAARRRRTGAPRFAERTAAGLVSQLSAGMHDRRGDGRAGAVVGGQELADLLDEPRLRRAAQQRRQLIPRACRAAKPSRARSRIDSCPSAAACISAARTRRACDSQNARSTTAAVMAPSRPPCRSRVPSRTPHSCTRSTGQR